MLSSEVAVDFFLYRITEIIPAIRQKAESTIIHSDALLTAFVLTLM